MESSETWRDASKRVLEAYYKNKTKLANWAGIEAMKSLQSNALEQQKNQEAESAYVRKNLWGASDSGTDADESDMGHTILGDITHPAPIIMPQPKQSNLPLLVAALASAGFAGLAGYMLAKPNQPPPPAIVEPAQFDDSTISIGLGRIEDYIADEGQ